jgi:hypothetical protein
MLARRNALKALQAAPGSRHAAAHQLATTILLPQNLNPNCDAFALANALCDLSVAHVNRPNPDTLETIYRSTLSARRLPAMGLNGLRQNAKYVLYVLWGQGKLILALTFSLNKSLSRQDKAEICSELVRFCLNFPESGSDGSTAERMIQHMPKWLVCTSWRTPEDIDIQESLDTNRFLISCQAGDAGFPAPALASPACAFC